MLFSHLSLIFLEGRDWEVMDTYWANMLVGSGHKECRKSQRVCRVLFLGTHQVLSCRTRHLNLGPWRVRNKRECTWDVKLPLCILSADPLKINTPNFQDLIFLLPGKPLLLVSDLCDPGSELLEMTSLFSLAAPRGREHKPWSVLRTVYLPSCVSLCPAPLQFPKP